MADITRSKAPQATAAAATAQLLRLCQKKIGGKRASRCQLRLFQDAKGKLRVPDTTTRTTINNMYYEIDNNEGRRYDENSSYLPNR